MRCCIAALLLLATVITSSALAADPPAPTADAQHLAMVNIAKSTLETLRGEIELYKIQHHDVYPSMADMKGKTAVGPYAEREPVNPFTHSSHVVAAGTATIDDGWTWDASRALLRVVVPEGEAIAIKALGSNAEIVKGAMPAQTPTEIAQEIRSYAIASMLDTLRGQMMLYQIQHRDRPPTWKQMADWNALLKRTDSSGNPGIQFGPYVYTAPPNPLTGKSALAPAGAATADAGWTYNDTHGTFRLVVTADMVQKLGTPLTKDDFEVVK